MQADFPVNVYINDFDLWGGLADTRILLYNNNEPIASIDLSYEAAKHLAMKLAQLVQNYEQLTNRQVPFTTETAEAVKKLSKENGPNTD